MADQKDQRFDDDYLWECYNALLLSHDTDRVRKLLVRYRLFEMSVGVPGDIVECGVFKGAGLLYWLKLLKIFSPGSQKRAIGFDTFGKFAGSLLPYEQASADAFVEEANVEEIDPSSILQRATDAGARERVEIVEGQLESSAPQYVEQNPGFRISLLNLDLDTYSGTMAALRSFYPVVSKSGVIVLDEYACRGWGESDAVDEFLADKDAVVASVPFSSRPTAFIIKK